MSSRLYECRVMHARLHPRAHRFAYGLFLLELDLDELSSLSRRLLLLRIDRPGLLSFRQRDYLPLDAALHNPSSASPPAPAGTTSLKARVFAHLAARGIDAPAGARVRLLTLPRVLGYRFNPVSFYFISTPDGAPFAALAEVTNTFHETKLYTLGPDALQNAPASPARASRHPALGGPCFRLRIPKHFYVSPFSDVDLSFEFRLRPPGERLAIQIDDFDGPRRTLVSTVTSNASPRPLRDRDLAWFSLKYPLVTLKVIAAIHWEALRLWAKRVPWFAKSARPSDQRDLRHPHASLAPRPASPGTVL